GNAFETFLNSTMARSGRLSSEPLCGVEDLSGSDIVALAPPEYPRLQRKDDAVGQQAEDAEAGHSCDDDIVAKHGVSVEEAVAEPGSDRDHLAHDDEYPGSPDTEPQARED